MLAESSLGFFKVLTNLRLAALASGDVTALPKKEAVRLLLLPSFAIGRETIARANLRRLDCAGAIKNRGPTSLITLSIGGSTA